MRNTLPKSNILRGYNAFNAVFQNGIRFDGSLMMCYVIVEESAETQSPIQWGFSVSKKRFPRAVDRNRLRRLLRESVRLNSAELTNALAEKKKNAKIIFNMLEISTEKFHALKMNDVAEEWKKFLPQILQAIK